MKFFSIFQVEFLQKLTFFEAKYEENLKKIEKLLHRNMLFEKSH